MGDSSPIYGALDLLILKTLSLGELHGLGVARRIEQITQGAFTVKAGSLFPALHRLEAAGMVSSAFGKSENRRDAKYYRLTAKGRRQFETRSEEWSRLARVMTLALRTS
jgi:transcriptional regulator